MHSCRWGEMQEDSSGQVRHAADDRDLLPVIARFHPVTSWTGQGKSVPCVDPMCPIPATLHMLYGTSPWQRSKAEAALRCIIHPTHIAPIYKTCLDELCYLPVICYAWEMSTTSKNELGTFIMVPSQVLQYLCQRPFKYPHTGLISQWVLWVFWVSS